VVIVTVVGGIIGATKSNKDGGNGVETLGNSNGVFMGPTTPTVLDTLLQDEAKNYTNLLGKPLTPNITQTIPTTTTTAGE